ncbi:hypothetical protein [Saccharibacillus sp. O23]|uniref:hypothetical protein n=1 Tax=Saccharibacillus sp. O23 TaxID=2009338 RepID=UPI00211AD599|nr:hypothetical protein [Saccharibacillus sp. O23]
MKKISHLQTKLASRFADLDPNKEENKNTKFADLIIDDRSLYQTLKKHDLVPSLGWGSDKLQRLYGSRAVRIICIRIPNKIIK